MVLVTDILDQRSETRIMVPKQLNYVTIFMHNIKYGRNNRTFTII